MDGCSERGVGCGAEGEVKKGRGGEWGHEQLWREEKGREKQAQIIIRRSRYMYVSDMCDSMCLIVSLVSSVRFCMSVSLSGCVWSVSPQVQHTRRTPHVPLHASHPYTSLHPQPSVCACMLYLLSRLARVHWTALCCGGDSRLCCPQSHSTQTGFQTSFARNINHTQPDSTHRPHHTTQHTTREKRRRSNQNTSTVERKLEIHDGIELR